MPTYKNNNNINLSDNSQTVAFLFGWLCFDVFKLAGTRTELKRLIAVLANTRPTFRMTRDSPVQIN